MKKISMIVCCTIMVLTGCSEKSSKAVGTPGTQAAIEPAKEESFLFRNIPWGASREDIISQEGDKFSDLEAGGNQFLLYRDIIVGNMSADLGFVISPKNEFIQALYFFNIKTDGYPYKTKPFIDAYSSLYNSLREIYGSPKTGSNDARSKGDDLQDYMEYYFKGGISSEWDYKKTIIALELSPKPAEELELANWDLTAVYVSPQMQEINRAQKKQGL